ncbi:hypothetical protein BD626DRAFT_478976 [Schizophyllum amplum]|uniref:Ubiquitin-like domain-containing protein n=1 Tax=Schizophyllum amplum TaxID=97359 RepID=A0A550CRS9_9AGAR|nr:hypothetical protein BD626DRAFT_478976 [Auriculariopsis ampla]
MPPKFPAKVHQLQIKTHTQTIFLTLAPNTTVDDVKQSVLDALSLPVSDLVTNPASMEEEEEAPPTVQDVNDFVLCREQKGDYETIPDGSKTLKDLNLPGWAVLYIRFKDPNGDLLPLQFTRPSLDDEEEATEITYPAPDADRPNKRKAPMEAEEENVTLEDIVDAI